MNRKRIAEAFSNIDDTFIEETLSSRLARMDRAPERTMNMREHRTEKNTVRSRRLFALILAACLVFAMSATAYAFNLFGIRDMFRAQNRELPEGAETYIQQHTQSAAAEDWSARITESLSDDTHIIVTVNVSGGDKYILAPTDADPDRPVEIIGVEGDQTLGEYAREQGKELLFVGATLKENEDVPGHGSQDFRSFGPSEMTILIQADKTDNWGQNGLICYVYAVDETWNKLTLDIPFELSEAPAEESRIYTPVDPDAIPGMTVCEAEVTVTPLGTTIRFRQIVTDEDAFHNIMKEEVVGMEHRDGGTMLEDDGNWYYTATMGQGTLNDTMTIRYYDWNGELIGEIQFVEK